MDIKQAEKLISIQVSKYHRYASWVPRDDFMQAGWVGYLRYKDKDVPLLVLYIRQHVIEELRRYLGRPRKDKKLVNPLYNTVNIDHLLNMEEFSGRMYESSFYEVIRPTECDNHIYHDFGRFEEIYERQCGRTKDIINKYFFYGYSEKEIGKRHGISESRVSQIKKKFLIQCRGYAYGQRAGH